MIPPGSRSSSVADCLLDVRSQAESVPTIQIGSEPCVSFDEETRTLEWTLG